MTLAEANRIIHLGSYDQALLDQALAVRAAGRRAEEVAFLARQAARFQRFQQVDVLDRGLAASIAPRVLADRLRGCRCRCTGGEALIGFVAERLVPTRVLIEVPEIPGRVDLTRGDAERGGDEQPQRWRLPLAATWLPPRSPHRPNPRSEPTWFRFDPEQAVGPQTERR